MRVAAVWRYPVKPMAGGRRAIYPAFRALFPNQVIRADDLARTMVDAAVQGRGESRTVVLENRDIRQLARSSSELRQGASEIDPRQ
jgi:hypothetical protein